MGMSWRWAVGALVAGAALAACGRGTGGAGPATASSGTPGAGACSSSAPRVTATGTGSARARPDLLTMVLGVHTESSSAAAALASDDAKAQALVQALEAAGVAKDDLQTSGLSISPRYGGGSTPQITGYQVDDTVTAKVRRLSSAGSLIDTAAAKAGDAIRFQGLAFSVTGTGAAGEAQTRAVKAATARAQAMAAAAGVSLGRLCSVKDVSGGGTPPVYKVAAGAAAAAPAPPIQPGTQEVMAEVQVVYAIGAA